MERMNMLGLGMVFLMLWTACAEPPHPDQPLANALTLAATFDENYDADYAKGNPNIFTAPKYDSLEAASAGMTHPEVSLAINQGHHGNALSFMEKQRPVLFFEAENNITYDPEDWSGAISLWLSLDPDNDLAPGYTDPIQITDQGYNDAALWVDFTNKNPRTFRMGAYGDLIIWNPENIGPDDNPAFQDRLLPALQRPFKRGEWTHVLVSFKGLNTGEGEVHFYLNGKPQGSRIVPEPFTWEYENARIFLGLNYIGLMDEVALFNRRLTEAEVQQLYQLENGLPGLVALKNP